MFPTDAYPQEEPIEGFFRFAAGDDYDEDNSDDDDFYDDNFDDFEEDFERVSQLDVEGRWVVSPWLELFGRGYYSFDESSTRAGAVGALLRSRCDCWELIGEVERSQRPSDTRFTLKLNLTGLGGAF